MNTGGGQCVSAHVTRDSETCKGNGKKNNFPNNIVATVEKV